MAGGKDICLLPGKDFQKEDYCIVPEDGTYLIQFEADARLEFQLNGIIVDRKALKLDGVIEVLHIPLKRGKNRLLLVISNKSNEMVSADFQLRICDEEGRLLRQEEVIENPVASLEYNPLREEPDLTGFIPGVGVDFRSVGRFGFTKGDGLLDFSMPLFGIVAKPYIYGFPQYQKTRMWRFSVLPDDLQPTGNHQKIYSPNKDENISADWNGVTWQQKDFSLNYTIHSGELLIETERKNLCLSQLKGVAAFHRIVLPLQGKIVSRPDNSGVFYDQASDGELAENWILLYGNNTFPEVPLQLIFRTSPQKILVERLPGNQAGKITVEFAEPLQWSMLTFPFGFEVFEPVEFDDDELRRGIGLCRKRSATALARIVSCREYYKIEDNQIRVIQKFDYKIYKDTFGTKPLYCAVLPPLVPLAHTGCERIRAENDAVPLEYPTKYGELYAVLHSTWSEYFMPIPPLKREFSLQLGTKEEISSDFDDYLRFYEEMPHTPNPGVHHFLYPYVLPMTIFNELTSDKRERLLAVLRRNLKNMLESSYRYAGPRGLKAHPWYERKEPYSGLKWLLNYLHVFSNSRLKDFEHDTVSEAETPYIEVDWGNGLALYSIWLAALVTGEWELIRQKWSVIRGAFDYFLATMDWACMCSPFCENGVAWSDGTNYGAYLGFVNMAEMIGDRKAFQIGLAAFAKMVVQRLALNAAAETYYPRYFRVEPWSGCKVFPEELSCVTHTTCYPSGRLFGKYRMESIYNMTTEGMYPEAFAMYAELDKKHLSRLLDAFEHSQPSGDVLQKLPEGRESIFHSLDSTPGEQEIFSYLMLSLYQGRKSDAELLEMVQRALENGRLSRKILGEHKYSFRRVPAKWSAVFLRDTVLARKLPRVTCWKNLDILDTNYPEIELNSPADGWIELVSDRPITATFNQQKVLPLQKGRYYRFQISGRGKLKIITKEEF